MLSRDGNTEITETFLENGANMESSGFGCLWKSPFGKGSQEMVNL
jgi:hypothetical protein